MDIMGKLSEINKQTVQLNTICSQLGIAGSEAPNENSFVSVDQSVSVAAGGGGGGGTTSKSANLANLIN